MNLRRQLLLSHFPFWALLVVAFLFLSSTLDVRVKMTERAAQTRARLFSVAQVMQHVVDLETGLRGYVITGELAFLEPYNAAQVALPRDLAVLERDGDAQSLARIRALIGRWQTEVAAPQIVARQSSQVAATALVKTGRGKKIIDSIRAEVAAYSAGQTQTLQTLEAAAAAQLRQLRLTLYGVGGLALLSSLLATLFSAHKLSGSFGHFTAAARRLTGGESGVHVEPSGVASV